MLLSDMLLSLSTSVCAVPAPPARLLRRCRELGAAGSMGLSLDARLPTEVQQQLIAGAVRANVVVAEVALALAQIDRRPLGSALSEDRDERRAVSRALGRTIALAGAHGVPRVLLYPWALPLHIPVSRLLRDFARDEPLPTTALLAERAELAEAALDRLRFVLDAALAEAVRWGTQLCFAAPAIWPHQVPSTEEVRQLQADFAGSPLVAARFSDWAHARSVLFGELDTPSQPPESGLWGHLATTQSGLVLPTVVSDNSRGVTAPGSVDQRDEQPPEAPPPLRLADACGTRLRLPLGVGESDWSRWLSPNGGGQQLEAVLAFDEATTLEEVERSRELLATALIDRDAHSLTHTPQ